MRARVCVLLWHWVWLGCAGVAAQSEADWSSSELHDGLPGIVDAIEKRWSSYQTPYVRVLAADPDRVSAAALAELRVFAERCLDRLQVSAVVRDELRRHPIRYLLCADPEDVAWFSGVEADGVALPRQRLILTHILPHEHELAHVLSDLAIAPIDAQGPRHAFANDPLLQEGLASYLGGRRGQAPDAMQQSGEQFLAQGMGDPFRLVGWADYFDPKQNADMRYAVGARLVAFLVARDGMATFLSLYRALSASPLEVQRRPPAAVIVQLEGFYGVDWRELRQEFQAWRHAHPPLGPRAVERPGRAPDRVLALDERRVEMWEGGESWVFHVRADAGYPDVTLRYGESLSASPAPNAEEMPPLRYSLMLRPEDVRLTDLRFDRLLSQGSMLRPERSEPTSEFTVELPRTQVGEIRDCWISASPRIKPE